MDPDSKGPSSEVQQKPPVENENIEPKSVEKSNTPAKSFDSSNNDVQKPAGKLTSSLSNNSSSAGFAANPQPGNFNGFKVFGISSLNPYQNKFVLL
jgi:hypothetical protein